MLAMTSGMLAEFVLKVLLLPNNPFLVRTAGTPIATSVLCCTRAKLICFGASSMTLRPLAVALDTLLNIAQTTLFLEQQ